ncbi:MAG: tRNA glutamyl-Q(34) synthetase GluQRS [Kordiimonadaceae bacterium]|nr:tRNA glutamyl-Q(34) synthetase GluQRS [Kordiimonadaceae bacterium]
MQEKSTNSEPYVTRFAPSPSGLLHKGHAYSALYAYREAQTHGGRFILRIEDIDTTRCKPEYTEAIYADLAWLGLTWETPVRQQSNHFADYETALSDLKAEGLVYPCFCTRKEIQAEIAKAPSAPHGPDGPLYPGTCKHLSRQQQQAQLNAGDAHTWRLNLDAALKRLSTPLVWLDTLKGPVTATPYDLGDVVLARKDTPTSYHLAVVLDDALAGITNIIRGQDLFHATHIHIILQRLLSLPTPHYTHHKLLMDEEGVRFAKRNKSATLKSLRDQGISAANLKASLGF